MSCLLTWACMCVTLFFSRAHPVTLALGNRGTSLLACWFFFFSSPLRCWIKEIILADSRRAHRRDTFSTLIWLYAFFFFLAFWLIMTVFNFGRESFRRRGMNLADRYCLKVCQECAWGNVILCCGSSQSIHQQCDARGDGTYCLEFDPFTMLYRNVCFLLENPYNI